MALRKIGLYASIIAASLLLGEVLARVYDWSPRSRDLASGDNLGLSRYYHSTAGAGDLVPDQDGHWMIWFHRPYHVQTNSLGLRNVEEPNAEAARILAVGDSQTFGPYLANEDTWPAWTENYLRQNAGDPQGVQVFNAGIAGYTIADELAYLREKGVSFKPHLVLLAVFENDLSDMRKENGGTVQRPAGDTASELATSLKVLGRNSAFVSVAQEVKRSLEFAAAKIDIRQGEGEVSRPATKADGELSVRYEKHFRDVVELLRSHDIAIAVVFIPSLDVLAGERSSETEPVIRALAHETQTPYLDLSPAMRSVADPAVTLFLVQRVGSAWIGNGHLSREGNAVIGRAVAEWLRARRLLAH